MTRCIPRVSWRAILMAALLALAPSLALAQGGGTIRGTLAGPEGRAISGAVVSVVGTRHSAVTSSLGAFTITGVAPGTYQLRAFRSGYRGPDTQVVVGTTEASLVALKLEEAPIELNGIVVSASRRAERLTDAPATITRIGTDVLDNVVGNSFAGALKEVKGLDFIQTGVTSVAVNARGFNSSFNNRMLMLEDGRVAVLPENGLPVGQLTATPKVDLSGIEVLVGPGSALYGADASNGVIALQSKDPREFPGLTVEASGGSRQYKDVQARYAGTAGSFGFKASGEFQGANDWSNILSYTNSVGGTPVVLREDGLKNPIDWRSRVARGTASGVYYRGENRLEVSGGLSSTNGVGQTNVGRNQLTDWHYNFGQAKFSTPHFFINAYRTQSTSGKSFALNRYAAAQASNPTLSADSLRMLSDWPSNGRLYAAEAQNNFRIRALRNTAVVWGGQYRLDRVSSDRQWLSDRQTGEDVSIRQLGAYAQTTTPVMPWLDVVLAGRLDDHQNYDRQFSPKAGLVFKPAPGQALRATYNRAFKSPTILQTNFFIPDWTPVISIYGNTRGFTVKNAAGTVVSTYEPLQPERNQTWELGYKGVVHNRLFLDVAAYRSSYEHFMSPLVVISNPFTGATATFAYDADGNKILNQAGIAPVTLIYYNLGDAQLRGVDGGVNYVLNPRVSFKGTLSLVDLQHVEVPAGREEATALNAPATKWTVGTNVNDLATPLGTLLAGASLRHVGGYYFRSGINMGRISNFSTVDLNLGYRVPRYNSLLNLGVSNLFGCTGSFTYASSLPVGDPRRTSDPTNAHPISESRSCGFNKKHAEMINMPEIGTMVFLGLQFQTR
ncbi:MAG TPA: TonB-dependent receptor [Longimicrobiaceae bacterium]|jgi:iron complex outermembrane receptor protein|nr:TonB-dependent receptor [Longimicrobiaceae bacterium]